MRHTLENINIEERTATCSVCGHVKITSRNSKAPKLNARWRCCKQKAEQRVRKRFRLVSSIGKDHIKYCEICGKSEENNGKGLAIDHCHNTGKIRGMLCSNCNTALGLFDDNIDVMKRAIEYVKEKQDPD